MPDAAYFRRQARALRNIAEHTADDDTRDKLLALSDEYAAKARELDAHLPIGLNKD